MRAAGKPAWPCLDATVTETVQSLLLRTPTGRSVRHLLLRVPDGRGLAARAALADACNVSFGIRDAGDAVCSLGITYAGLEALRLPDDYLAIFQRLAPSFRAGAVRRSTAVGDCGAGRPARWAPEFAQDRAHVVASWHGTPAQVDAAGDRLTARWSTLLRGAPTGDFIARHTGERLGSPPGEQGEWTHFGFRDDVSDIAIDDAPRSPLAPDLRRHAPGALLLGFGNDDGLDRFVLSQAPETVRRFFRGASFGILRKMAQDCDAFEDRLAQWRDQLEARLGPVDARLVRAKLCGRWPDGRVLRPGATAPPASTDPADFVLDLDAEDGDGVFTSRDDDGLGCPFASHVRRMRARADDQGHLVRRPLLRRSVPYGPAAFGGAPRDRIDRGQWGHFFCADIENQFEHLLGQWGARAPIGADGDDALDPLMGPHDDPARGLSVAFDDQQSERFAGFRRWTTTRGMAYAWYPAREGLHRLLTDAFVPDELAGPWL